MDDLARRILTRYAVAHRGLVWGAESHKEV